MDKKNKKKRKNKTDNKFNFVSMDQLEKVSLDLKDGEQDNTSLSSDDTNEIDVKPVVTSDDAIIDIEFTRNEDVPTDGVKEEIDDIEDIPYVTVYKDDEIYQARNNYTDKVEEDSNNNDEEVNLPFENNNEQKEVKEKKEIEEESTLEDSNNEVVDNSKKDEEEKPIIEELEEEFLEEEEKEEDNEEDKVSGEKKENVDKIINKEDNLSFMNRKVKEDYNDYEDDEKEKKYFGFSRRIILIVSLIVILFVVFGYFVYQTFQFDNEELITYTENTDVTYSVCDNGISGNITCSNKDLDYFSEVIRSIKTNFSYDVTFSKKIDYDMSYRIVAVSKIVDATKNDKVLYQNDDLLFTKTYDINDDGVIKFNTTIDIDFNKYNNATLDYMKKYNLNVLSTLNVILYADEADESREIASIKLNLGKQTFKIIKNISNNVEREMTITSSSWNDNNSLNAFISIVILLVIFVLIYRIIHLFLMARSNRNKYQVYLDNLLSEYDRLIVIARDGYESNVRKKIIKVKSFDELLEIRSAIEKPIIFSRVNDVKSEFIVEDDEQLYKYVLKEADL